jgi:lipoprotein-anchoring transpeptidase ErfK/SrfK
MLLPVVFALGAACRHSHPLLPGETVRKAKVADARTLETAGFPAKKAGAPLYEWTGSNLTGPLRITIDLSEQLATLERGGQPAGWTYVATGKRGHATKTGRFYVSEKVRDKVSSLWGQIVNSRGVVVVADARAGRDGGGRFVGAPMPYWMRIYGAVGMHAGFIPNPGNPASHGCIRLPRGIAEIIFDIVKIGTPVTIRP